MAAKLAMLLSVLLLTTGEAVQTTVPWNVFNRQWGTPFADLASGVAVNASGIYVVGHTRGTLPGQTSAGNWDPYVRRYDASGNEIWTRQFGVTHFPSFDVAGGVAAVTGAVYVVGTVAGALPGQIDHGGFDDFIRKYDEDGVEVWTRQVGSTQLHSDEFANGVAADATGVYVVGDTDGVLDGQVNAGGADGFITKYDHDGNLVWGRQFGTSEEDVAWSVATDATGVYIAGDTLGTLPGQTRTTTAKEGFVRMYDVNGNEVWTRQFSPIAPNAAVPLATTVATHAGRVYVGGRSRGPSAGSREEFFIRAYNSDGTDLWMRKGFGEPFFASRTASLAVDATGIVFVSASFISLTAPPGQIIRTSEKAFIRRYDLDGNERWTREFVNGAASGVAVDASGIYIVGDTRSSLPDQVNAGEEDAFLVKVFESTEVDEMPPVVTCPPAAPSFVLNVGLESIVGTATDVGGSGPLLALGMVDTSRPGQQMGNLTAMDWAGNVGTTQCPYLVRYNFGFLPPTARPPVVNTATAGRTIPIRWSTRDARTAITDPSHFVGITVREVSCPVGTTTNQIDPSLEPPVGLTQVGLFWEYGWKTKTSMRGDESCQEVTVHLDDTVGDRVALFKLERKEKKD